MSSSTDSMNPPLVGPIDDALLFEPSRRYRRTDFPNTRRALLVSGRRREDAERMGDVRGSTNAGVCVRRGFGAAEGRHETTRTGLRCWLPGRVLVGDCGGGVGDLPKV